MYKNVEKVHLYEDNMLYFMVAIECQLIYKISQKSVFLEDMIKDLRFIHRQGSLEYNVKAQMWLELKLNVNCSHVLTTDVTLTCFQCSFKQHKNKNVIF